MQIDNHLDINMTCVKFYVIQLPSCKVKRFKKLSIYLSICGKKNPETLNNTQSFFCTSDRYFSEPLQISCTFGRW